MAGGSDAITEDPLFLPLCSKPDEGVPSLLLFELQYLLVTGLLDRKEDDDGRSVVMARSSSIALRDETKGD